MVMILDRREGQAATKVGVAVGGRIVAVGTTVDVSVGGRGVGVSGMMSLVAARQAKVEIRNGSVHKNNVRTEWLRIRQGPLSNPWKLIVRRIGDYCVREF
jgi:hypothetical protein